MELEERKEKKKVSIHTALTCRLNMKHKHVHTLVASTTNALKFIWKCDNIGISCIATT